MTFLYLPIWQKMTYFALYFQLCVLYSNRNYMKRLLSPRGSFWYAKNVCRLCTCLSHIWRVMTFLHLLIWQKVTYLPCVFSCVFCTATEIIWKDCSHREEAFDMQNMSMLYFLIWHMKSDDIFTSANMAKLTYFALHFQLCVLYCNRNYMKRWLSLRETFWYAKHRCRFCICLSHNMKSDDIFTSPNMAKSDLFCLAFSVVCVVLQQKLYEEIALTERKLLICKICV